MMGGPEPNRAELELRSATSSVGYGRERRRYGQKRLTQWIVEMTFEGRRIGSWHAHSALKDRWKGKEQKYVRTSTLEDQPISEDKSGNNGAQVVERKDFSSSFLLCRPNGFSALELEWFVLSWGWEGGWRRASPWQAHSSREKKKVSALLLQSPRSPLTRSCLKNRKRRHAYTSMRVRNSFDTADMMYIYKTLYCSHGTKLTCRSIGLGRI